MVFVLQCCSVLQCVAVAWYLCCSVVVCCSVLQLLGICVAVRCSVFRCASVCFDVLQCIAVYCSVEIPDHGGLLCFFSPAVSRDRSSAGGGKSLLQHVAVCCSVLQCGVVCCSVLQFLSSAVSREGVSVGDGERCGGWLDISYALIPRHCNTL